jgi:RNA polymerase sigma-70 factor (ECF subfamily)
MADIYRDIEAEIPRLRRYARVLVRNIADADDLVQDCVTRALAKLHLWQEGTNLRAWLFSILHNQHINQVRRDLRTGRAVEINDAEPALSRPANQDKCLELRDLERALARLPEEQRAAILLVGVEGFTYQQVADVLCIPTGTVRSRISRGRDALRILMGAEPAQPGERTDGCGRAGYANADRFSSMRPARHSVASLQAGAPLKARQPTNASSIPGKSAQFGSSRIPVKITVSMKGRQQPCAVARIVCISPFEGMSRPTASLPGGSRSV